MNLLRISYIKSLCQRGKILSLSQSDQVVKLEYNKMEQMTPEVINMLNITYPRRVSFDVSTTPKIIYKLKNTKPNAILDEIEELIEKISGFHGGQSDI